MRLLHLFCISTLTTAMNTAKAEIQTITVTEKKANKLSYSTDNSSISHNSTSSRLKDIQSVSVVPKTLLDDYQVQSLSEALRFVSGVNQANTLAGTEDGFTRRGFGSNSDGSIYRDGIRSNLGLNVDATAERVEVLKGSASLLYGIQNPGGVINVISKKPQYRQHSQISVRAKSSGGGSGSVDVTGPLGKGFAYRLIAEKQHEDYWRNFGINQHTLIAPSLQWYGENSNLLLRYTDYQYDIPYDRGTAFINGKPVQGNYNARLDDKANHAWGHTRSFTANYQWQFTENWRSLLNFGFNQREYNNNEVRIKSINVTSGKVTRTADANRGFNHKNQFISWELAGQQTLFNQEHNLTVGADYEINQTYRAHQYSGKSDSTFNLYHRHYNLMDPITDSTTENSANGNKLNRIFSRSLYLKDTISLTDHWILVVAGRYQHYTQQASQHLAHQC